MKFNGVFAVEKPSGISSAQFLNKIQEIFTKSQAFREDIMEMRAHKITSTRQGNKGSKRQFNNMKAKLGHGGTLDPLASGVMVIGVGLGTKQLPNYLTGCSKTYETEALFGVSTTTGDSEGEVIGRTSVEHITKESVLATPEKFIGNLKQTPPIFAALKMNGKPLYEYAREGIPLPMPIKTKEVKVYDMKVFEQGLLSKDHKYETLKSQIGEDGSPIEHQLQNNPTLNDDILYFSDEYLAKAAKENLPTTVESPLPLNEGESQDKLPLLHFVATVSSGTYIRSLISDFGKAVRSSAYMVKLIRSQQAQWELGKNVFSYDDFRSQHEMIWSSALQTVMSKNGDVDIKTLLKELSDKHKTEIEAAESTKAEEKTEPHVSDETVNAS